MISIDTKPSLITPLRPFPPLGWAAVSIGDGDGVRVSSVVPEQASIHFRQSAVDRRVICRCVWLPRRRATLAERATNDSNATLETRVPDCLHNRVRLSANDEQDSGTRDAHSKQTGFPPQS